MSSVYYGPDYAVQGASDFEDVWMKPKSVTIQMKAIEQFVVLFIILCKKDPHKYLLCNLLQNDFF